LTPWLIYWVILSLILLVESWTVFIIGWLPFYSWIRLFALSYLVLPQTQGAKLLYANYIEPFISNHERQIDVFIGDLHEKGSKAGLGYLKQLIDLIRQRVLNLPPTREEPPAQPTPAGYAQSLLSRFAMPSARASTASDFYSMLSGAVVAATSSSSATTARSSSGNHPIDPSAASGGNNNPLFPSNITTKADKQSFLSSQREKLAILVKTLDREQRDLDLAYGDNTQGLEKKLEADVERRMRDAGTLGGHDAESFEMKKNRSDNSFQNIEREELEGDGPAPVAGAGEEKKRQAAGRRTTSGGWNPSSWFGGGGGAAGSGGDGSAGEMAKEVRDAVQGMSSSVDRSG
jgi:uncharacterized membrane protein YgcG